MKNTWQKIITQSILTIPSCKRSKNWYSKSIHFSLFSMDTLTNTLQSLWLNTTQAKLYLAWLWLWSAPITRIAQKAGVHRVTAYDSMKALVSAWYFLEEKKWSTSFFQPLHPDLLYQKEVEKMVSLEQILPSLQQLIITDPIVPRIQFVQWIENCKHICRHLLETTETLDCFLWSPIPNQDMIDFIDGEFETKRIKRQIIQRVVCTKTGIQKPQSIEQKKRLRQKIALPWAMLSIQCGIYLFTENKIMYTFFSSEEMSALIIESKQLTNTQRSLFDYFWSFFHNVE